MVAVSMHCHLINAARCILVLKADRLHGEALRHFALAVFPGAAVMIANRVAEARAALAARVFDLLITGVMMLDGDVLEWLAAGPRPARHVLVVTGRRDLRVLERLRVLPIDGVFDPLDEGVEGFGAALAAAAAGRAYWSTSVLDRLVSRAHASASICRMLTPTEQLVFAVIGDGTDDHTAAERLGLKPSTIQTVRRALHRKLGVQHKGDLVRLAAQYGFVQFTPDGVVRPGFAQLVAAGQAKGPSKRGRVLMFNVRRSLTLAATRNTAMRHIARQRSRHAPCCPPPPSPSLRSVEYPR